MNEEHWSVSEPRTIELDGVTEVRIALVKGRFDVLVTDNPVAILEVSEVDGQPLDVSLSRGLLKIEHFNSQHWLQRIINFQSNARAVISVAVPRGTFVHAATVTGDGMVSGSSETTLKTVGGSLLADATEGMLTVETVSGEIIARDHTGHLVAKSVSGEVMASGLLDEIRASTVSGSMSFDVHGAPNTFAAKSVSGDVTLRLPAGVGVEVSATTASGSVLVDDARYTATGQNVRTTAGPLRPRVTVRTSSVSGNVAIIHAPDSGHPPPQPTPTAAHDPAQGPSPEAEER